MMGKVETQQAGGLADVMSLHQKTFRLIDDIIMYITDSSAARGLVDNVTKVSGRISQLGGTPGYSGQALRQLSVLAKIGMQ